MCTVQHRGHSERFFFFNDCMGSEKEKRKLKKYFTIHHSGKPPAVNIQDVDEDIFMNGSLIASTYFESNHLAESG
eukprot:m.64541 g.64541  ORF g.64541 m.64541 type:complete len:75 (+) comp15888_c0_seq4:630-854(+)